MENIYDRLIKMSLQRMLDLQDCIDIGVMWKQVCDAPKSPLREDCLFIIKNRLWNMPKVA